MESNKDAFCYHDDNNNNKKNKRKFLSRLGLGLYIKPWGIQRNCTMTITYMQYIWLQNVPEFSLEEKM